MPASLSLGERIRGKRTRDIQLPNPTGEIDERILAKQDQSRNPLTRLKSTMQRGRNKVIRGGKRAAR